MKLIYQQILAFMLVILAVLGTAAVLFGQFSTKVIYQDSYINLEKYANGLMSDAMLYNPQTKAFTDFDKKSIKNTAKVLQTQGIDLAVYLPNKELVYANKHKLAISTPDWHQLNQHKAVRQAGPTKNNVVVYKPYVLKGKLVAVVAMSEPVSYITAIKKQMNNNLFASFWIAAVIGVLLSFLIVQVIILRLHRVQRATQRIVQGEYDFKLPIKHRDEIGRLANDINEMAVTLEANETLNNERDELTKRKALVQASQIDQVIADSNAIIQKLQHETLGEHASNLISELTQTINRVSSTRD